jgi:hypothetical protein
MTRRQTAPVLIRFGRFAGWIMPDGRCRPDVRGGEGENDPPEDPPENQASLEADARAAIDELMAAGAEIPAALTKAVDELAQARKDAARYRTNGNEVATKVAAMEAQFAKVAAHLGIEDTDPESVAKKALEENESLKAEIKQRKLVDAIGAAATKEKADAAALADSRTFMDAVAKLDPAADDFASALEAEMKKAIEANPKLKATQAAGRSGTDHNGNGDGDKPKSLADAVTAAYAAT